MPGEHANDALEAGAAIAASGRGLIFTQLGEAITKVEAAVAEAFCAVFDRHLLEPAQAGAPMPNC